jgi:hypothetical protein
MLKRAGTYERNFVVPNHSVHSSVFDWNCGCPHTPTDEKCEHRRSRRSSCGAAHLGANHQCGLAFDSVIEALKGVSDRGLLRRHRVGRIIREICKRIYSIAVGER